MTLHVTNGDATARTLRRVVDGPVLVTADVLHEGPCPRVEGDAWHDVRARFLAGYGHPADEVKASLAADDRTVLDACTGSAKASAERTNIVLWFEHDLFDQLAIIRTLDLIARRKPRTAGSASPRVSLICIGAFPGVDRFIGLGQLTADQLATLAGTGMPVTAGHFSLATDAWHAFRSADPKELAYLARQLSASQSPMSEGGPVLRFLGPALLRFLAEFPSVTNGLSQTEALALGGLLGGETTAGALFAASQAREAAPFMGDATFYRVLRKLAEARVPLIAIDAGHAGGNDPGACQVAITESGRDVLACRADHVRLNGIDCWLGGSHLAQSHDSPWRWDAGAETLVS